MKRTTMEVNGYQCEVCGYKSQDDYRVEMCEKGHGCKHETLEADIQAGMSVEITKRCFDCHKEFETLMISDSDSYKFYEAERKGRVEALQVYEELRASADEEDILPREA